MRSSEACTFLASSTVLQARVFTCSRCPSTDRVVLAIRTIWPPRVLLISATCCSGNTADWVMDQPLGRFRIRSEPCSSEALPGRFQPASAIRSIPVRLHAFLRHIIYLVDESTAGGRKDTTGGLARPARLFTRR